MPEQNIVPEVVLKLTRNGVYTWSIRVCGGSHSDPASNIINRIKEIDLLLKDTFPNHPVVRGNARFQALGDDLD